MAIIEGNYVKFPEHADTLITNLFQLYCCDMFVDMVIVCHGYEIFAHKNVIAAASPLLRERITEFGNDPARIHLESEVNGVNINVDDIKLLVEFIYKGQVCVPESRIALFLEVGNHFQVFGLFKQASNFGNQLSFISQSISSYNCSSQHTLGNTAFGGLQCQDNFIFEDPLNSQNVYNGHNFSGFFSSSILTTDKVSDSAIKQDKTFTTPALDQPFSDICIINPADEPYNLLTDRNIHLNVDESDPKLNFDLHQYSNDASSVQDGNDFSTIATSFPADLSDDTIQIQSEQSKDIFEDRGSLSSSGASDPDILFINLGNQTNSCIFSSATLDNSNSNSSCLSEIPFQPCKIPPVSSLPERQMRLKVKDSIGGVSLQDTSQGEKAPCVKGSPEKTVEEVSSHTTTEGQLNDEVILEDSIEVLDSQEADHPCSHCQVVCCSMDELTSHLHEEHNIGTVYKCLLCQFKTLFENTFIEHGKNHLGSQDHQCSVCGKKFKTRATLRNHLACHASNKWFKCQECKAHYSQRNNLIKHLASEHRLDKDGKPIKDPFSCPFPSCSFVTWASHNLKSHETRCHTKDKFYKCTECSYSATEKPSLIKHKRIHTQERPYICDICGLRLVTASSFKRHCQVHTKEKPYECKECGKQYADKKRLRDHLFKHTSTKPFQCNICQYSCRRKDNLQSHIKRTHGSCTRKENINEETQEKQSRIDQNTQQETRIDGVQ